MDHVDEDTRSFERLEIGGVIYLGCPECASVPEDTERFIRP
jgi:hypothetical protein